MTMPRGARRPPARVAPVTTISMIQGESQSVQAYALLTVRQAAERLGIGIRRLKQWTLRRPRPQPRHRGGHHRIADVEIESGLGAFSTPPPLAPRRLPKATIVRSRAQSLRGYVGRSASTGCSRRCGCGSATSASRLSSRAMPSRSETPARRRSARDRQGDRSD